MGIIESIILGLIQGLTEFLPVSSSGHLIAIRQFMNLSLENTMAFDVVLHIATLVAILIYFKGDISRIFTDLKTEGLSNRSNKLLGALIVGTLPAGLLGFLYGDKIESFFRNPILVAYSLIAGSLLFWLADRFAKTKGGVTIFKGFLIGIFQSLALISGFSRSGSTISGGLLVGLSREESIKFSFLLGIPIITGAGLKTLIEIGLEGKLVEFLNLEIFIGFIVALLSGLWAVRFLVRYLSNNSFNVFIVYRLLLAILLLLVSKF
jgi:undecaprenyl-diphosphatase